MPNITIGADASGAQGAMDQFNQALINSGKVVGDFTNKTLEFNKASQAFVGVVEQMSSTGQRITRTFEITATSVEAAGTKITNTANQIKQQFRDIQAAAARAATADVSKIFPMPSGANIQNMVQYTGAITNLQRAFAQSGASSQQLNQMLSSARTNMAAFAESIPGMTPQMQTLARSILSVGSASTGTEQQFTISWAGIARTVSSMLIRRAISEVISLMREGINQALEYSIKLQQVANVTGQAPGAVRGQVGDISAQYGIAPTEAASLYQQAITSQAGNAAAGINVLNQAMMLGRATGIEYSTALKLVTSSLDAFHLSTEDAGRVTNVLAAVQSRSRVPIEQMQVAIGRIGPLAKQMGIDFEQIMAMFLTIEKQGGRPTEAFTRMNQVLGAFERPGKAMKEWLDSLGAINAQTAMARFGGNLPGLLEKLNQDAERTPELMAEIGGSLRTFIGFLSVGGQNTAEFARQLEALNNVNFGKVSENFEKVDQTFGAHWEKFSQRMKNFFAEDILSGPLKLLNMAFDAITNATDKFSKTVREHNTNIEQIRAQTRADVKTITETVRIRYEPDRAAAAEQIKMADDIKNNAVAASREAQQAWAASARSIADAFRSALSDVRREIAQTRAEIDASKKAAASFEEKARAALFQERYGATQDPYQKQLIIQERMQEIDRQVMQIQQTAFSQKRGLNAAEKAETDRMWDEKLKLSLEFFKQEDQGLTQNLQHWTQYLNQVGQQAHAAYARTLPPGVQMPSYQPIEAKYAPGLSQQQQREEAINQLIQQRNQWEKLNQDMLEKQLKTMQDLEEKEKTALRLVDEKVRALEKFQAFTPGGELQPQYRKEQLAKGGEAGWSAVLADFQAKTDQLRAEVRAANANLPRDRQVSMAQVDASARLRLDLLIEEKRAIDRANDARKESATLESLIEKITKESVRATEEGGRAQIQKKTALDNIQLALEKGRARFEQGTRGPLALVDAEAQGAVGTRLRDAADAWNTYVKAQLGAEQALQRIQRGEGDLAKNTEDLRTHLLALGPALDKISASRMPLQTEGYFGLGISQLGFSVPGAAQNYRQQVTGTALDLQGNIRTLENANRTIAETNQTTLSALQALAEPAGKMGQGFRDAALSAPKLADALQKAADLSAQIKLNVEGLTTAINNLRPPAPAAEAGFIEAGIIGAPRGAEGGLLTGPRGTDNIPAWLTAGEFVVNPESTRRFYTQLVSINSGRQPRYFAGGGLVTVGDINVNVSGGDTSERTIREIAQGINTELRRGTVRFQTLQDAQ